ncbi:MAG: heparinase II/III family protein, partial [Gammaproteobacteria bacterium]|nr:heparinase II/III family protein [Gammaproteobacteria bacterium]
LLVGAQAFIDYPQSSQVADANHRWGVAPFHYVDAASQHCYRDFVERRVVGLQPVQVTFSLETPARFRVQFDSQHDLSGVEFACYLYCDGDCVAQHEYQTSPLFEIARPKPAGDYQVKAFMRSRHGAILVFDHLPGIPLDAAPERALLGADLIHDQLYQVNGFAPVQLKLPCDWSLNPFNDRTWRWNLLQLNMLPLLVGYDEAFDSSRGLDLSIALVRSWSERFLADPNDTEAWHDHCTAMRGSHLLVLLAHVKARLAENAETSLVKFQQELQSLLLVHAERLSCEEFYSEGTNHGFDQALTLGQIAETLPAGPEQTQFRAVARQRISKELDGAFAADGGHVENSPAYLNYGLKQALSALTVLHAEDPDDHDHLEQQLKERLERSILALAHMLRPDATLPIIGDTQATSLNNFLLPYADRFQHYDAFLYALTQGRRGHPPQANALVLPASGYAVFRDAWQPRKQFEKAVHLVMTCGFLSTYHRHDDDLSFVLMAAGIDWFVDGGLYNYQQNDPQRVHARSARAHNLSMPFGEQATRERHAVTTRLQSEPSRSDSGSAVCAETTMFPGFASTRRLDYVRSEGLIYIHDSVSVTNADTLEKVRQRLRQGQPGFVTRFQVPAELAITLRGNGVELRLGEACLRLQPCGEDSAAILPPKIYPAGIAHQPETWYSTHLGRLAPLTVIEYRHHVDALQAQFEITLP